jgi:hypothetical protein
MAKRVGSIDVRNPEHGLACGPRVIDDDLGLSCVAVPVERDREPVRVAFVEFNEHDERSFWRQL